MSEDGRQLGRRLGARIAACRHALGWSQDQLAERLGVASETVSRMERGVALPSLLTLQKLSVILGVRISDLMAESSNRVIDQADVVQTWLAALDDENRRFVIDLIKRCCEHLATEGK